jgi:mannose-6-phosphate isomerase-like protein (cupin superfamily)
VSPPSSNCTPECHPADLTKIETQQNRRDLPNARGIWLEALETGPAVSPARSIKQLDLDTMRIRYLVALPLLLVSTVAAQTPAANKPQGTPAQTPSQGKPQGTTGAASPTAAPAPAKPAPAAVRKPRPPQPAVIVVRDVSGTPLQEVQVTITGSNRQSAATDAQGNVQVPLADGSYRLRFEHEGFITLERDVAVRAARPEKIEVALSRAPVVEAPPPPPPPAPAPAPPPPPEPEVPAGPATNVSISAFLDKNFIGREPLKESVLGCTPAAITRVLQLRDPLAAHSHGQVDEVLYVVAGTGSIRLGEETLKLEPGSVTVIPRGMRHGLERSGRNPLIVLSTLAGAPCKAGSLTQP